MRFLNPIRSALMVLMLVGIPLALSGCSALLVASSIGSIGTLAQGPPPEPSREVETNRQRFERPVAEVYSALVAVIERDDRKIVDQDPEAHSLLVSYPFSWLHNNWGGVITITCTSVEGANANPETTVRVVGGTRDAIYRIRSLGESILQDLGGELLRRKAPA